MFVDEATIFVRSGKGGRGCVSFRRERFRPRGGPDGGDGGKGGDVVLEASPHVHTLLDFSYQRHFVAPSGGHGRGNDKHGRDGEDLVLRVPLGTLVRDASTGEILGDLVEPGQRLVVARGGHGGKGNARFATPWRQAPRFSTPPGPGEERWVLLELKLMADVGLVGLPNAGKSSLLRRISRAMPKVADYPFTTLNPHLGVVESEDAEKRLVVADLPGLVEGAHRGAGLGLRFLRHVERTRIILFVLDADPGQKGNPISDLHVLKWELQSYQPSLLKRPAIVAVNKIDIQEARPVALAAQKELEGKGIPCYPISALTGEGIKELIEGLFQLNDRTLGESGEENR